MASEPDSGPGTREPGLTRAEAAARLDEYGPNEVAQPPSPALLLRFLRSLRDPLVLVLLAALALTVATRDFADSAVIGLVVLVNSIMGLRQEVRADRAVDELSHLVASRSWVVREGRPIEVPTADLVPGDVILLSQGDLVPADAVLVDGVGMQVDESTLTGEASPSTRRRPRTPGRLSSQQLSRLGRSTPVRSSSPARSASTVMAVPASWPPAPRTPWAASPD